MSSARRRSVLDKPLPTRGTKSEVSLSAFAFLFSEFIQYSQQRVETAEALERKCVSPPPCPAAPHSMLECARRPVYVTRISRRRP